MEAVALFLILVLLPTGCFAQLLMHATTALPLPTPTKPTLMLKPAFALVSMKLTDSSRALLSPSSSDTCLTRYAEGGRETKVRPGEKDRQSSDCVSATRGCCRCFFSVCPYPHSSHFKLPAPQTLPLKLANTSNQAATHAAVTHRLSTRSVLLPTRKMITSLPRSVRTSWIHRTVLRNDWRSVWVGEVGVWVHAAQ